MPKTVTRRFRVWDGTQIIQGTAREILERFRSHAAKGNEISKMSVEEYARSLIEDAPYFVSDDFLSQLENHDFDSDFEKALACLAAGSQRIHILP